VGGGTVYNLRHGAAVSAGSRVGGGQSAYSSGSLNIDLIFIYLHRGPKDGCGRRVRMQAIRPQNWTCIAWGSLLPSGNSQGGALAFGGGSGSCFFSCPHSALNLSLQETGAALLDFVRSCICFIAGLNLAPKPV